MRTYAMYDILVVKNYPGRPTLYSKMTESKMRSSLMQVSIVVKEKYYVEVPLLTPHEVCLSFKRVLVRLQS